MENSFKVISGVIAEAIKIAEMIQYYQLLVKEGT